MLEKIKTEKMRKIIIILLAIFVTLAFSIKLEVIKNSDISEITNETNYIAKILYKIDYSIDKDIFKSLLLFGLLSIFFNKTLFRKDIKKQGKNIFKIIISLILSFFMVFGYSYYKINSWDMIFANTFQLFKATIVFIGYYIVFISCVNYLFDILIPRLQQQKIKESTNKVYNFIFVKHSFIMPLIIILICWLPYIIAYYPGILTNDSANQIKQYFGYEVEKNSATYSNVLIDENVKITNHHPVLNTLILGSCLNIGHTLGNDNLGIFIYTFLQIILFSSTLAYLISNLKNLKINNWIRTLTLLIFSLIPVFPFYAVQIVKDTPFTCVFIMYFIKLYKMVNNANNEKYKIRNYISIVILSLLVSLFRNNGIYVIILSLPFVAIIDKINRKKILITSLLIILIYMSYAKILLPCLKITPSGIREMLSIPFQQTARYVEKHNEEMTEEEKNIIDKVLEYDTIAERYNPVYADPVKNKYKIDATKDDLKNYFKVWLKELLNHPTTYIQATMNNVYGYFYPESKTIQFVVDRTTSYNTIINETGEFNYHYIDNFKNLRDIMSALIEINQKLPLISWIVNIGLNVWAIMLIFVYLIYAKRYKYIIYLLPIISIILVCLASPVNAYMRYSIPFIFAMPITIAFFINILNNKKEEGVEKNEK